MKGGGKALSRQGGWYGSCRCADGVGDDPTGAGQRDADRVARPIEVVAWCGGEIRNPDQQFEDHDLRSEEARGKRRHDAGEDGDGGSEKAHGGGVGPEHLGRRQPSRDPAQQAGHVNDVGDAKGNGANTEEEHEEGPAARNGGTGRGEDGAEDKAGGDQAEFLKDIADGVEVAEIHKGFGHPEERENRVDSRQDHSAGTRGAGQEERDPAGELKGRSEVGERYAQREVGADVLPGGGEIAGGQAEKAEKDGGSAVDVKPEIGCDAA